MNLHRHIIPLGLLLIALLLPVNSIAQIGKRLDLKFSTSRYRGVCAIGFAGANAPGTEKPMQLEFSYRVRDGNFGVNIKVNGWPRAQEADPNQNVPLTLIFDNGKKTTARSGGYSSGFNDKFWAGWGVGSTSEAAYAALEGAGSVQVNTDDGLDLGKFDLQMDGMAYNWIKRCAAELRAAGPKQ